MEESNANNEPIEMDENEVSSTTTDPTPEPQQPPLPTFGSLSTPSLSWTALTESLIKETDPTSFLMGHEPTKVLSAREKKIAAGFGPGPAFNLLTLEDLNISDGNGVGQKKRRRRRRGGGKGSKESAETNADNDTDKPTFGCAREARVSGGGEGGGGAAAAGSRVADRQKIQTEMLHSYQRFTNDLKNPRFPENFEPDKDICAQIPKLQQQKARKDEEKKKLAAMAAFATTPPGPAQPPSIPANAQQEPASGHSSRPMPSSKKEAKSSPRSSQLAVPAAIELMNFPGTFPSGPSTSCVPYISNGLFLRRETYFVDLNGKILITRELPVDHPDYVPPPIQPDNDEDEPSPMEPPPPSPMMIVKEDVEKAIKGGGRRRRRTKAKKEPTQLGDTSQESQKQQTQPPQQRDKTKTIIEVQPAEPEPPAEEQDNLDHEIGDDGDDDYLPQQSKCTKTRVSSSPKDGFLTTWKYTDEEIAKLYKNNRFYIRREDINANKRRPKDPLNYVIFRAIYGQDGRLMMQIYEPRLQPYGDVYHVATNKGYFRTEMDHDFHVEWQPVYYRVCLSKMVLGLSTPHMIYVFWSNNRMMPGLSTIFDLEVHIVLFEYFLHTLGEQIYEDRISFLLAKEDDNHLRKKSFIFFTDLIRDLSTKILNCDRWNHQNLDQIKRFPRINFTLKNVNKTRPCDLCQARFNRTVTKSMFLSGNGYDYLTHKELGEKLEQPKEPFQCCYLCSEILPVGLRVYHARNDIYQIILQLYRKKSKKSKLIKVALLDEIVGQGDGHWVEEMFVDFASIIGEGHKMVQRIEKETQNVTKVKLKNGGTFSAGKLNRKKSK